MRDYALTTMNSGLGEKGADIRNVSEGHRQSDFQSLRKNNRSIYSNQ